MAQPTTQQLAELLIGIARAQAAVVNGLENELAGIRSGRVIPSLQNAAHLRDHPDPTLADVPVRVLLAAFGRAGPDAAAIARDLERLFSGAAPARAAAPTAAPAAAPAAPAAGADASGDTLDFSNPA
ncbi:MAG TPA: hypothetical protein VMI15_05995 [Burkholderiales bacterium]|nr:hypothetical protein [Burkholderiales bacterium]